jgi:hypothetical protein
VPLVTREDFGMLRSIVCTAALAALSTASASAQNCSNTSVGFTPLIDLGPGFYQGFEGGLYPGGSIVRPMAHEIAGLGEVTQIVPRNAQGQPDPQGRIVVMSLGMSNAAIHWNAFTQMSNADPLRSSKVFLFQGAHGGIPAEEMDDPSEPYWVSILPQKMQQAGVTPAEVQVIWMLQANAGPTAPFPQHAQALRGQMADILRIARDKLPNARIAYLANRIYAGYATTQLNPEPWAYEQSFAVKWLVEDQMQGDPALNFDPDLGAVEAPWLAWGPYTWADGLIPRSDGLTWVCSDFNPDGTHPSTQGAQKNMGFLLDFVHSDTTARSWYLAQPNPVVYGFGKSTSIATTPSVGWTGTASLASNDFFLTLANAVPGVVAIGYRGPQPALLPFAGGALFVQPLIRMPPKVLGPAGQTSYAIPVTPLKVGKYEHFGFWFRDPAHPDGTAVGLSDALQVLYLP